jgi:hypothetical protein
MSRLRLQVLQSRIRTSRSGQLTLPSRSSGQRKFSRTVHMREWSHCTYEWRWRGRVLVSLSNFRKL